MKISFRLGFTRLLLLSATLLLVPGFAYSISQSDLLPEEQAFRFTHREEPDTVILIWDIADGYHLYQKRFRFQPHAGLELGEPVYPKGQTEQDATMGHTEVYRGHQEIRIPILSRAPGAQPIEIEVSSQGCADAGVCYPPHKRLLSLATASAAPAAVKVAAGSGAGDLLRSLGLTSGATHNDLLPPDEAFRFYAEVKDASTLLVSWQIADGYYLYRDKFAFALPDSHQLSLGSYEIPHGEPKHDPEYGAVEVFHQHVEFPLSLVRDTHDPETITLTASFQGCADRGVCYPPMQKKVTLQLPAGNAPAAKVPAATAASSHPGGECQIGSATGFVETKDVSEQCAIATSLGKDSIWLTAISFLGMGLLLAFTPCIFPMIPILSGIIVGHGHKITTGRAFMLSLSYVIASALAYTVFGVLAGLFGSNLQAIFQSPRIILAFSTLFIVLALSMFDLFSLQLPGFLQARIAAVSNKQHGGTLAGAAVMGALSALIVGPCVAAPLAGALIYIGQTGDALLGGLALFSMGIGMGIPLLAIGASAGKLLPRAGLWMNSVKAIFGIGLLAIAVWLLDRILPPSVTMLLWALLLILPSVYLSALDALPQPASGWQKLWKGLGVVMLVYGVMLLIGVASNSTDPLQPLRGLSRPAAVTPVATTEALDFKTIHSLQELEQSLTRVAGTGQSVVLDFYADWCVSCKEMERYTFSDPNVIKALTGVVLLKADVTDNTGQSSELLQHFGLIGPPATLFFGPDGTEHKDSRVIGYMEASDFLKHLGKALH